MENYLSTNAFFLFEKAFLCVRGALFHSWKYAGLKSDVKYASLFFHFGINIVSFSHKLDLHNLLF
jgi:hypothetical protein